MLKLMPDNAAARIHDNASRDPWISQAIDAAVAAAKPWLDMSDEDLWTAIFTPHLPRAWQVWSSGHCPSCSESVLMYDWVADPLAVMWKMTCPHCAMQFPTNDFGAYHASGLDERGLFDPKRADRNLLFNTDHPDPADPLHQFGVDDGHGYVGVNEADPEKGEATWRFIAAYLIYGQWKKLIVAGACNLAQAYLATGQRQYARKSLVLFDRIADVYPEYDFRAQGFMYDTPCGTKYQDNGYVSTWHDACMECDQLIEAWSIVRDAVDDPELIAFTSQKAAAFASPFAKSTGGAIRDHIENHFIRDTLANERKVHNNYPRREMLQAKLHIALGGEDEQAVARTIVHDLITKATAVDGVTGEKGLANYSSYTIVGLAQFLAMFDRACPGFFKDTLAQHPALAATWRFHLDTWCLSRFYPHVGDSGYFGSINEETVGAPLNPKPTLAPSVFTLFWQLYEATGDVRLIQTMARHNRGEAKGLPRDAMATDAGAIESAATKIIAEHGLEFAQSSVNKTNWGLGILRAGQDEHRHATWMHYQNGGGHCHADRMNLGLFAHGHDFMPEFGYPPVNRGDGWLSDYVNWYRSAAAHNTVVVDERQNDLRWRQPGTGVTRCFKQSASDAGSASAMIIDGLPTTQPIEGASDAADWPTMQRFERAIVVVEIDDARFYLVDVFRVIGGSIHQYYLHSHSSSLTTRGLSVSPGQAFESPVMMMRNVMTDPKPQPGWAASWKQNAAVTTGRDLSLNCIGLTTDTAVSTCEGWVQLGDFHTFDDAWIPRVMLERRSEAQAAGPLSSTLSSSLSSLFVSIIEPVAGSAAVDSATMLAPQGDRSNDAGADVAIEVSLADGSIDCITLPGSADHANDVAKMTINTGPFAGREVNGLATVLRKRGDDINEILGSA